MPLKVSVHGDCVMTKRLAMPRFDNVPDQPDPNHFVSGGRRYHRQVVMNHLGKDVFTVPPRGSCPIGALGVTQFGRSIEEVRRLLMGHYRPPLHLLEHEVLREMPARDLKGLHKFGVERLQSQVGVEESGVPVVRLVCAGSLVGYQTRRTAEPIWIHPVLCLFQDHPGGKIQNYYELNPNLTPGAFLSPLHLVAYRL